MGASASTGRATNAPSMNELIAKKTELEVTRAVLPIYYTKGELTAEEKKLLLDSWTIISTGRSSGLQTLRSLNPHERLNPAEHFGSLFYERFHECHCTSRSLFTRSTAKQSALLVNMITFIIREIESGTDDTKFVKTMQVLANSHNRLGIKSVEYGIFGEVLFWTLKQCLGDECYNVSTHLAWIKLYSKILAVIIPITVKYELDHRAEIKSSEEKRMQSLHKPLSSNQEIDKVTSPATASREVEEVTERQHPSIPYL